MRPIFIDGASHDIGDYIWGMVLTIIVVLPLSLLFRRVTGRSIEQLPLLPRMAAMLLVALAAFLVLLACVHLADILRNNGYLF